MNGDENLEVEEEVGKEDEDDVNNSGPSKSAPQITGMYKMHHVINIAFVFSVPHALALAPFRHRRRRRRRPPPPPRPAWPPRSAAG